MRVERIKPNKPKRFQMTIPPGTTRQADNLRCNTCPHVWWISEHMMRKHLITPLAWDMISDHVTACRATRRNQLAQEASSSQ